MDYGTGAEAIRHDHDSNNGTEDQKLQVQCLYSKIVQTVVCADVELEAGRNRAPI
jgi:hypothetical protein